MTGADHVAGNNGRHNSRDLTAKVHGAAQGTDAAAGSDQGRKRPDDRRRNRDTCERDADPYKGLNSGPCTGRSEDTKPHRCSPKQHGATYAISVPSKSDETADQPPS